MAGMLFTLSVYGEIVAAMLARLCGAVLAAPNAPILLRTCVAHGLICPSPEEKSRKCTEFLFIRDSDVTFLV